MKLGRQGDIEKLGFDKTIHGTAVNYRFSNGVPNQLTLLDAPWNFEERVNDFAFFAQDQWTMDRLTLNLGVRYNEVRGSTPVSYEKYWRVIRNSPDGQPPNRRA